MKTKQEQVILIIPSREYHHPDELEECLKTKLDSSLGHRYSLRMSSSGMAIIKTGEKILDLESVIELRHLASICYEDISAVRIASQDAIKEAEETQIP